MSGESILTPAWLEPGGGFGPAGVQLTARAATGNGVAGDGWVLSGVKRHVAFASSATRLLVLARTGDGERDVDLFLVDPRAPGVTLTQQMSVASDSQYRVELDGVAVDAADRVGGPGTGWATWETVRDDALILLAAWAVGAAEYVQEITVQYAKDREQFDKPIGAFQAIAHYLADRQAELDGARTLVHEAAWARADRAVRRPPRADGQAVRVPHRPAGHRHRATGLRRQRLHDRLRRPALLPSGQGRCSSRGGATATSRS